MTTVLHLTAHLGGGVGKALSGLARQAASVGSSFRHRFVTLEVQEKTGFLEQIVEAGAEVVVCPGSAELYRLVEAADIVQLEWWNHPATLQALCRQELPSMRLLVWSHVSGLQTPIIPARLLRESARFLFTSPCSYVAPEVLALTPDVREKIGVVPSCGGFPPNIGTRDRNSTPMAVGYVGSLNFAKLHPEFVSFLTAAHLPGLTVKMIGDVTNRDILEQQCNAAGRPGLLQFRGYVTNIAPELASLDVLAYLLNPSHYGTTENALLEAMSMGVIPIVLDNPAERQIVRNRETGLIVSSPEEFAAALRWLSEHPEQRQALAAAAVASVRERFSVAVMDEGLNRHYTELMQLGKTKLSFSQIFGPEPADWFLACQRTPQIFTAHGVDLPKPTDYSRYAHLERTKGTACHFHSYFPEDRRLKLWAGCLEKHGVSHG